MVERLLRKLFGRVEKNYRFDVCARAEGWAGSHYGRGLIEIYYQLKEFRGYQEFVRTKALPPCDFFVPKPAFVVEFDESQHFTEPRKITLQNYPKKLKLGFPKVEWIRHCEEIDASDTSPLYRDEQRAWYDTLRDFLPSLRRLRPTVRLYAQDMQWCHLDPKDPKCLSVFKNLVEMQRGQFK